MGLGPHSERHQLRCPSYISFVETSVITTSSKTTPQAWIYLPSRTVKTNTLNRKLVWKQGQAAMTPPFLLENDVATQKQERIDVNLSADDTVPLGSDDISTQG